MSLSTYLSVYLSVYLSICPSICLCVCSFIHLIIYLSVVYLFISPILGLYILSLTGSLAGRSVGWLSVMVCFFLFFLFFLPSFLLSFLSFFVPSFISLFGCFFLFGWCLLGHRIGMEGRGGGGRLVGWLVG